MGEFDTDDEPMSATEVIVRRLAHRRWQFGAVNNPSDRHKFVYDLRAHFHCPFFGLEDNIDGLSLRELVHLIQAVKP